MIVSPPSTYSSGTGSPVDKGSSAYSNAPSRTRSTPPKLQASSSSPSSSSSTHHTVSQPTGLASTPTEPNTSPHTRYFSYTLDMKRLRSKPAPAASSNAPDSSNFEAPDTSRRRHPSLPVNTPKSTQLGRDYPDHSQDQGSELITQIPSILHQKPLDLPAMGDNSSSFTSSFNSLVDTYVLHHRDSFQRSASGPDLTEAGDSGSSASLTRDSLIHPSMEEEGEKGREKAFLGLVKIHSRERERLREQAPISSMSTLMSFPKSPTAAHSDQARQRTTLRRKQSANAVLSSSTPPTQTRARSLSQSPLPPSSSSSSSPSPHTPNRTNSRSYVHRKLPPPVPMSTLSPLALEPSQLSPLPSPRSPAPSASSYTHHIHSPSTPPKHDFPFQAISQIPLHVHPEDLVSFDSHQSSHSSQSRPATSSHAHQSVGSSSKTTSRHSNSHSKKWSTKEVLGFARLKVPTRSQSSPSPSPHGSVPSSRLASREHSGERDVNVPRERQRALTPAGMVMEAYRNRKRFQEAHEARGDSSTLVSPGISSGTSHGHTSLNNVDSTTPLTANAVTVHATSQTSYFPSGAASLDTPFPLSASAADDFLSFGLPESLLVSTNLPSSLSTEYDQSPFFRFDAHHRERPQRPRHVSTNTMTTINTTTSASTHEHGSYVHSKPGSTYTAGTMSSVSSLPPPVPAISPARTTPSKKSSHPSKGRPIEDVPEGEKEVMPYYTIIGSTSGKVVAVGGPEDSWVDFNQQMSLMKNEKRGITRDKEDRGVMNFTLLRSKRSFSRDLLEKRSRRPSETKSKQSNGTESEKEKDRNKPSDSVGRTITRKISGKWRKLEVSVEGRAGVSYNDESGSGTEAGVREAEKLKAWDFVSNPSSPATTGDLHNGMRALDSHDDKGVFSDGGYERDHRKRGRGRRGSLRLSLQEHRSNDVEIDRDNGTEETEERGRSTMPVRNEDILTPTAPSSSKKSKPRKPELYEPLTAPDPAQSRHRHTPSGATKLWKLVKRISTGGLREKYQQDSADAPPVPALPNDYLLMIQPRPSLPSTQTPDTQESDDARDRFLRSRTSLSGARDVSPQPARDLRRRPSLGVVKSPSHLASPAPPGSKPLSPIPSPNAKLPVPPPPPVPTPPVSQHQPLSTTSLPSSAKSYNGFPSNQGVIATRSSSPVSTSDVASSRFFHRAQSTRSSTSSYADELLPFNVESAPPMPTSNLGKHILPPSEFYDQVRQLRSDTAGIVVTGVRDPEVRGNDTQKARPHQTDQLWDDEKTKKGKTSPLKIFNRTKSVGAVNSTHSSAEPRKLSLDDWTIVRTPSVDSDVTSLPPPRRPAYTLSSRMHDLSPRADRRLRKDSRSAPGSRDREFVEKLEDDESDTHRTPKIGATEDKLQMLNTAQFPSQIPTQPLGPPPSRPSRSSHLPSAASSTSVSRVTSPARPRTADARIPVTRSGEDVFSSSLGSTMSTKSEVASQWREKFAESEERRHFMNDVNDHGRKARPSTISARPTRKSSSSAVRPSSAPRHDKESSSTLSITPPAAFSFKKIELATGSRKTLTEREKAERWDDLLERSERAGGTLHFNLGEDHSESNLDSDQISVSASELLS